MTDHELKMAELYGKMSEYVKMEEELPFTDFHNYYQQIMAFLQSDYQALTVDEMIKSNGICQVMGANAQMRAARKDADRKKFQKMAEKSEFWSKAIKAKLLKDGMDAKELEEKMDALWS